MQAAELIKLFSSHYPLAVFSSDYISYLEEQQALGHPIRRAHSGQPLVEFLRGLGLPDTAFEGFLDPDSKLVFQVDFPQLLASSPAQVDAYFRDHFARIFALQEAVLDSELLTGFNRHGGEHLRAVTHRTLGLLRRMNGRPEPSARTQAEAVIAGYLHDIGNLLSRKEHGIYGIYLLTQLLAGVDRDEETINSFLRVLEAVLFHEVEYGTRFASLDKLSPSTLALIVADKTDVSFKRVSSKSNMPEALQDAHMLVNLLAGESQIRFHKDIFEWAIHFRPKIVSDEAQQFSALLKRAERVWVPWEWQRMYRRDNIEYVFMFQATFLRVYFSRLTFAIQAVFALKPSLRTFRLVIEDDERGVSLHREFGREDYQDKLSLIGNNLFKNMAPDPKD